MIRKTSVKGAVKLQVRPVSKEKAKRQIKNGDKK